MHSRTGLAARERRRVVVALLAAAAAVTVGVIGVAPSSAAANKGSVGVTFWPASPWQVVYGQDLTVEGYLEDLSSSCRGITRDCDNPGGYVYLAEGPEAIPIAVGDLSPTPGTDNYSYFSMTMRGQQLAPGHYDVAIAYAGDFEPYSFSTTLDVAKNPCRMSVTQTAPSSRPGEAVVFGATLTGSVFPHPGATITFTDGSGAFLSSGTVDGSEKVTFSTAGLPQGDTTIVATYDGTAIDDGCTGAVVHHVDTDPPPVAVDDSYSTAVGMPITVHPLLNDYDIGGGAIRGEYLNSPDAGDVEALDDATLVFTPPDDYIGETSMTYIVYDSIGQSSNEATIHFSWGCTPQASNDGYDVAYGQPLTVATPGVTGNDTTCDLPTEVASQPSHGTLSYDTQGGGFTYTPSTGYLGPDSFTYRYSQGLEVPVDARVDLVVHVPPPTTTTTTVPDSTTSTSTTTPESTTTTSTTVPDSTTTTSTTTPGSTTTTSTTAPAPTTTTSTTTPGSTTTTSTTAPAPTTTTTSTSTSTSTSTTTSSTSSTTSTTAVPIGPPTITAIAPDHGAAGDRVLVIGSGFVPAGTTVTVGGVTVPAEVGTSGSTRALALADDTTLRFTVPDGAAHGTTDLIVTTDSGSAVLPAAFTVEDGSTTTLPVDPGAGPATGGDGTAGDGPVDPAQPTTLPYTGSDTTGTALAGLVLVAGGGAAALVARRRLSR